MANDQINNTVDVSDEALRAGLLYAGKQWDETLTQKQIDNVVEFFKSAKWKVIYG